MNTTIGSRLKEERVRLGFSQEKFSELGGMKKLAQLRYEADKRSPDSQYLALLAQHGADVNYILTGIRVLNVGDGEGVVEIPAPKPEPIPKVDAVVLNPQELEMLELFRRCSSEQKKDTLKDLETFIRHNDCFLREILEREAGKLAM